MRHSEEVTSHTVLWKPLQGRTVIGRSAINFIDSIQKDTGLTSTIELYAMPCWTGRSGQNKLCFHGLIRRLAKLITI